MRKTYTITGTSQVRPTDLPDGFTVVESATEFVARVDSGLGDDWRVQLVEGSPGEISIQFLNEHNELFGSMYLNDDGARGLRDALSEYLSDSNNTNHRVFSDKDEDLWFEIEPGMLTMANDWDSARDNSSLLFSRLPLQIVRSEYGPLKDVTNKYPQ